MYSPAPADRGTMFPFEFRSFYDSSVRSVKDFNEKMANIGDDDAFDACNTTWTYTKDTWMWAREKPVLATLMQTTESVADFALDKVAGISLVALEHDYIIPALKKLDTDVLDPSITFCVKRYVATSEYLALQPAVDEPPEESTD